MDQHPIPQNVTGFQFKLIGTMTVKQFGYVGAGVIAAVITYYLPIKGVVGILLKILLIPFFGASGAIVAFIPIDGRPVDVMAGNFLKALFSPNQYIYRKNVNRFSFSSISASKSSPTNKTGPSSKADRDQTEANRKGTELQKILMKSSTGKVKNAQDLREEAFLKALSAPQAAQSPQAPKIQSVLPPPLPTKPIAVPTPTQQPLPAVPPPIKQVVKPEPSPAVILEKEKALEQQIESAKKEEQAPHDPAQLAPLHQKTTELEKQLQEIRSQKQSLEQEILSLKNQLQTQKTTVATPAPAKAPTQAPNTAGVAHVRSVPKEMNKKMGLLVSDTPNVVTGVVKDPRGNVLPNILVEIKDKSDNPVRAFKTNALGNFASATPLTPGTYSITLEDPKKQNTFDAIQITAANQIMLPIEIISYDKREQLRKDLFN